MMRARVRTVNRVGRHTYLTTSSGVGEHLLATIVYYVMIYPYYLIFKWCFYMPIKKLIEKRKVEEE